MKIRNYLTEQFKVDSKKDLTGHSHKGEVNADGDGKTTECIDCTQKHVHKIFQWLIQPADGHIHNLSDI